MGLRIRWSALNPPPFLFSRDRAGAAQVHHLCSALLWRHATRTQRVAAILSHALWPLVMTAGIAVETAQRGSGVRRAAGKGLPRQCREQFRLILRHRLSPKHYYRFRLYLPELWPQADDVLLRNQIDGIAYPVLQSAKGTELQPLQDKAGFARFCAAQGLPHVPTLMVFARGQPKRGKAKTAEVFGRSDLFLKPVRGSRGGHSERWQRLSDGRFRSAGGRELDPAGLQAHIAQLSQRRPILVQPALSNHRDLLDLTSGALCTMRVITWRNEAGGFEVTDAILRMPVDPAAPVDNFHAGGIAAPIDLATGTLGRATDLGSGTDIVWHERHPRSGAAITGRRLPMWNDVLRLAERAHQAFDRHVVIGWDIALVPDGPCLIEGNQSPGVGTLQRAAAIPLGRRRFGQLLAFHLRQHLATRSVIGPKPH
jgi:hypothetical protein